MATPSSKTVLAVFPLEPHPTGYGSQKRAAAHLSALVEVSRVHLVVLDSRFPVGKEGDEHLLERCESVSVVKYRWRPRRVITNIPPFPTIAELFDPAVKRGLPSPDNIRKAFSHVNNKQIDTVLCFKLMSATIFDYAQSIVPLKSSRKIVDFDDIQSLADQRAMAYEKHGFEQSIIDSLFRRQIRRAEEHCLKTYDAVWVCSEIDRRELLSRKPRAQIHTIPNSVVLTEATPPPDGRSEVHLLFVAAFGYGPNEDGILWFCSKILPIIRASSPARIKLTIVGYNPPPRIKTLEAIEGVLVTGGVDSVVPYYRESDIVIAPIRSGGGTRIKILEGMNHVRPVVSTTLGAEGIEVKPGENIMIGDTPDAFASACLGLIQDLPKRRNVAQRGRQLIEERYSNAVISESVKRAVL